MIGTWRGTGWPGAGIFQHSGDGMSNAGTVAIKQQKRQLRQAVIAQRDALSESIRDEAGRLIRARLLALPVMEAAKSIFVFVSYASEVDTHPLIDTLLEAGRRLAVPKIVNSTTMLSVPMQGWDELLPDPLGILTPIGNTPDLGPFDVAITPGVAFTLNGERLGYGRGYYDRWLSQHTVDIKIALCYEDQIVPSLPTDEFDLPVDIIVTEKRVIKRPRKISG